MGWRYHRSVRLLPGLRLNLGMRGMSLTAGIPGLSVNVGPRGVYRNLGLPGSGFSNRTRLDKPSREPRETLPPLVPAAASGFASTDPETGDLRVRLQLSLDDHGRLVIRDGAGGMIAPALERRVRREHEAQLFAWLDEREREIDAGVDAIESLHRHTPSPEWVCPIEPEPFTTLEPESPPPLELSLWDRLFGRTEAKTQAHDEATAEYERARDEWRRTREAHAREQANAPIVYEQRVRSDVAFMEETFEDALDAVSWPRPTHVRFALDEHGTRMVLDVDLPEAEDMPTRDAERAARGYKLNLRTRTASELRGLYARHVHGVLFHLAGLAFHVLPALDEVVVSGYSQRRDPATALEREDHLVSVRVPRAAWSRLDFTALEHLDPIAALGAFECVRDLSDADVFAPIEPLARLDRVGGESSGV